MTAVFGKGHNRFQVPVASLETDKWLVATLSAEGLRVQQPFILP